MVDRQLLAPEQLVLPMEVDLFDLSPATAHHDLAVVRQCSASRQP